MNVLNKVEVLVSHKCVLYPILSRCDTFNACIIYHNKDVCCCCYCCRFALFRSAGVFAQYLVHCVSSSFISTTYWSHSKAKILNCSRLFCVHQLFWTCSSQINCHLNRATQNNWIGHASIIWANYVDVVVIIIKHIRPTSNRRPND